MMDRITFSSLSLILPPEIVSIIDEMLIEEYKRKNALACSKLITGLIYESHRNNSVYRLITIKDKKYQNPEIRFVYLSCVCGEVIMASGTGSHFINMTHPPCSAIKYELSMFHSMPVGRNLVHINYYQRI